MTQKKRRLEGVIIITQFTFFMIFRNSLILYWIFEQKNKIIETNLYYKPQAYRGLFLELEEGMNHALIPPILNPPLKRRMV